MTYLDAKSATILGGRLFRIGEKADIERHQHQKFNIAVSGKICIYLIEEIGEFFFDRHFSFQFQRMYSPSIEIIPKWHPIVVDFFATAILCRFSYEFCFCLRNYPTIVNVGVNALNKQTDTREIARSEQYSFKTQEPQRAFLSSGVAKGGTRKAQNCSFHRRTSSASRWTSTARRSSSWRRQNVAPTERRRALPSSVIRRTPPVVETNELCPSAERWPELYAFKPGKQRCLISESVNYLR